jgi:hypothetical protein
MNEFLKELDKAGIDYDGDLSPVMVYTRTAEQERTAKAIAKEAGLKLSLYMPGLKSEDKAAEWEVEVAK